MVNQQSAARNTSSRKQLKFNLSNYSNDVSCELDELRVDTHILQAAYYSIDRPSLFTSYVPTRPLQQRRQAPQQQQQSTPSTPLILLPRVFSGKRTTRRCDTGTNACHWFLLWIPSTTTYDLRVTQLNKQKRFSH